LQLQLEHYAHSEYPNSQYGSEQHTSAHSHEDGSLKPLEIRSIDGGHGSLQGSLQLQSKQDVQLSAIPNG
jgi:hypothetical protein